jgi:hypothetical protein
VKVAKHVLILLGLVGLLGILMPLAEVRKGVVAVALSAKDLTFGLEKTHAMLDRKLPAAVERRLGYNVTSTRDDLKMVADGLRWAIYVYAPAALLVLVGCFAIMRGRLGRGPGFFALLLGLILLGTWIGMHYAIDYALAEADMKGMTIELRTGAHMLLVPAAAGILIGLAALIKPEPRRATV